MSKKTKILTAEDFQAGNVKNENENQNIEVSKQEIDAQYRNRGFGKYPNRKYRRSLLTSNKRTKQDIKDKRTSFDIFINRVTENVAHGKLMHEAYLNEISQMQIELEQSLDYRVKKSLVAFTGNEKTARRIFMENKRLQAIVNEKKMMIHG